MLRLIVPPIVGALLGGGLGYFNPCTTGACPFTTSWWGGAVLGGLAGLTLGLATAPPAGSRPTGPAEGKRRERD